MIITETIEAGPVVVTQQWRCDDLRARVETEIAAAVGLNKTGLATAIGVTPPRLQQMLNADHLTFAAYARIPVALGVNPYAWLERVEVTA